MSHEIPDVDQLQQNFSSTIREVLSQLSAGEQQTKLPRTSLLWHQVEQWLTLLSDADQLRLAGHVIVQLSELCHAKAEQWLTDWQEQYDETEPLMDDDLLAGLVQRTMYLDLSDLIRSKPPAQRSRSESGSVVGAVDKKKLLSVLNTIEEQESAKHKALAVAHDENVTAWIETIDNWLNRQTIANSAQTVWFSELCTGLHQENPRMTPVKVFLALLLGGYPLEQPNGFYESDILVTYRLNADSE